MYVGMWAAGHRKFVFLSPMRQVYCEVRYGDDWLCLYHLSTCLAAAAQAGQQMAQVAFQRQLTAQMQAQMRQQQAALQAQLRAAQAQAQAAALQAQQYQRAATQVRGGFRV